ncbi:MAG: HlyD family efflux transporter periplasmic adaptor subunit, partial [Candidatus Eisenbacteria bacterium]|nr:HlyD family efflux transporter periplasmic adaptor subunit [Candidatus Latescibacterota bacterium]MBD3302783.1 HlyD family efflux transporter periplasmic adaptor subunit [Candidatus Eisenbacteria bacterium]
MNEQKRTGRLRKILLPIGILVVGLLVAYLLKASRQPPGRETARPTGALVEVEQAIEETRTVRIPATGTVTPRHEVNLTPQVAGRVEWVHPDLVAGGDFAAGEALLRIEPADFELAVEQAAATVAQAEYQLEVAKANAAVAREEWERMQGDRAESKGPDPLVLHGPQLDQAEANLASAKARLATAELNLERTVLRAPFNCRVRRQSASPGQVVSPSSVVAVLYGTDLVEIEVGLSLEDLAWLDVPGGDARVLLDAGTDTYAWTGEVDRTVGVLDEVGRLARVV